MTEEVQKIFSADNAVMVAVALWIIKQSWELLKGTATKKLDALNQNTHAIIKLQVQIEHLFKALEDLPKMRRDIDSSHNALRDLRRELGK